MVSWLSMDGLLAIVSSASTADIVASDSDWRRGGKTSGLKRSFNSDSRTSPSISSCHESR